MAEGLGLEVLGLASKRCRWGYGVVAVSEIAVHSAVKTIAFPVIPREDCYYS